MESKRSMGYLVGVMVMLSYGLWYIGLGLIASNSNGAESPILPLLLIEIISVLIVLGVSYALKFSIMRNFDPVYSVIAGILFALGNYAFFVTINTSGVPFASSFAAAEIVVFSFLMWVSAKKRRSLGKYILGSAIIASGLTIESFRLSGSAIILNSALVEYGALFAILYGGATFFYYLSLEKTKNALGTMFGLQITEVVIFGALFAFYAGNIALPAFNLTYAILIIVVGLVLFLSLFGETIMMNILMPFGHGAVSTGYVLSDMQLVPVLIYSIAINPASWISYTPGIVMIVLGSILLEWK